MKSPLEVFNSLAVDPTVASPLSAARPVLQLFSSNHAWADSKPLGNGDLLEVRQGYASQAGMYGGDFLARYDPKTGLTAVLSMNCSTDSRLVDDTGPYPRLFGSDTDSVDAIDITSGTVMAEVGCRNCGQSIPPPDSCDCSTLVDGGDSIIAVRPWGNKLAATSFDKTSLTVRSSVILDATDADVVTVPGQLWTLSRVQGLVRWDPATGTAVSKLPAHLGPQQDTKSLVADNIFYESGSFWTWTDGQDAVIQQHDPRTFAATAQLAVPGLAGLYHGANNIWLEARTNSNTVTVEQLDPATAHPTTTLELHSFVANDDVGGQQLIRTYVPDLQVDNNGIWFDLPADWQKYALARTTSTTSEMPNIVELHLWGNWVAFRWQHPRHP